MKIHAVQDFLHDFAADIFQINVDDAGRGGGELFLPVRMLVVDGRIETEILGNPGAFVVGAGDTDDAAAMNLSNLPSDASGGASGGGDDEGFALFRRRNLHAEKSSETVETEHTKEDGVRDEGNLRQLLEEALRGRVDDNVLLKAGETRDAVTLLVVGVARLDDFGETARAHDFADPDSGKVTIDRHPDAHGRIDREVFDFGERLSVFQLGYWGFRELQITGRNQPLRARLQAKLMIGIRHARREYLRRKFRGRWGRDPRRCRHRKNRRRARRGSRTLRCRITLPRHPLPRLRRANLTTS